MCRVARPDTVTLAVLASRAHQRAADRFDAVLAWTEAGLRHYEAIPSPTDAAVTGLEDARFDASELSCEALTSVPPTSAGLTWRTWALPTIPIPLRHLTPAQAAAALAVHFGRSLP